MCQKNNKHNNEFTPILSESSIGVNNSEVIDESNLDSTNKLKNKAKWYSELSLDNQKLIDQLSLLGDVKYIRNEEYILEQIVNAISKMNIKSLEKHLKSLSNFEDQEEFLAEINLQFKKFKENKDTFLIPYSGKCNGKSCDNYGNKGQTFIGNTSNTFFNVVIEKENNKCVGLCECYRFTVNDEILNQARIDAAAKKMNEYNFTDSELDDLPF